MHNSRQPDLCVIEREVAWSDKVSFILMPIYTCWTSGMLTVDKREELPRQKSPIIHRKCYPNRLPLTIESCSLVLGYFVTAGMLFRDHFRSLGAKQKSGFSAVYFCYTNGDKIPCVCYFFYQRFNRLPCRLRRRSEWEGLLGEKLDRSLSHRNILHLNQPRAHLHLPKPRFIICIAPYSEHYRCLVDTSSIH